MPNAPLKPLTIQLAADLHLALKLYAVRQGVTMTELVLTDLQALFARVREGSK